MTPTLSIIIVSYNTRDMTLACIRSVFDQTRDTSFELIVVDNASSDGSADAIEAVCGGRVRLMRSPANLGFAGANNVAAGEAAGEYLLLLNPDTVVLNGAIDRLVAFSARNPAAGIWGGRTVFADGRLNPASCWREQTIWSLACCVCGLSSLFRRSGIVNPEAYGGWKRDSEREVDTVSGCFFLIRRELWRRLGGFDPAFFMYGEEADLCLRARKLGATPCITPEATIVHHGGASERVRADKLVRLLTAKVLLIRRHWPRGKARVGVLLLSMWPLSRAAAWSALRLMRRGGSAESAATWWSVWSRRREWLGVSAAVGVIHAPAIGGAA